MFVVVVFRYVSEYEMCYKTYFQNLVSYKIWCTFAPLFKNQVR